MMLAPWIREPGEEDLGKLLEVLVVEKKNDIELSDIKKVQCPKLLLVVLLPTESKMKEVDMALS